MEEVNVDSCSAAKMSAAESDSVDVQSSDGPTKASIVDRGTSLSTQTTAQSPTSQPTEDVASPDISSNDTSVDAKASTGPAPTSTVSPPVDSVEHKCQVLEKRLRTVRDILKHQSSINDDLMNYCRATHQWMMAAERSLQRHNITLDMQVPAAFEVGYHPVRNANGSPTYTQQQQRRSATVGDLSSMNASTASFKTFQKSPVKTGGGVQAAQPTSFNPNDQMMNENSGNTILKMLMPQRQQQQYRSAAGAPYYPAYMDAPSQEFFYKWSQSDTGMVSPAKVEWEVDSEGEDSPSKVNVQAATFTHFHDLDGARGRRSRMLPFQHRGAGGGWVPRGGNRRQFAAAKQTFSAKPKRGSSSSQQASPMKTEIGTMKDNPVADEASGAASAVTSTTVGEGAISQQQ